MVRNTKTQRRMREGAVGSHPSLIPALLLLSMALALTGLPGRAALACTQNADCNDGLACNGVETCDTQSATCQSGTPVDCSPLADQCNDAACVEPSGSCSVTPKINGFGCNDGNRCTTQDTCQGGVCVGGGGADTDGDGYCDIEEVQAGCNPNDVAEIPAQPNLYSGGRSANSGEILLTFRTPGNSSVVLSTDDSCKTAGHCSAVTNFCTSGRIADPCTDDSDCNQPADTCRIVINYASTSDLLLGEASLKIPRQKKIDVHTAFQVAPGCSQKVDLALPSGFGKARLKLKAAGTLSGRLRKDTDRILFVE